MRTVQVDPVGHTLVRPQWQHVCPKYDITMVHVQEPKSLEDLTGLTQLHAETQARGMSLQEDPLSHPDVEGEDIPDMEDDWTSL